jgi:hypothetical protein
MRSFTRTPVKLSRPVSTISTISTPSPWSISASTGLFPYEVVDELALVGEVFW